jgi:hypothetical protein
LSWQVGAFYERQEHVDRLTDFSLFGNDEPDPNAPPPVVADSGDVYGLRGQAAVQLGDDPQVGILVFRAAGEFAFGDFEYRDLELMLDAVLPAPDPFTVAFRAAAGRALGDLPAQRLYYLGGRKTVRSFPRNSREGDAYALIKAELGTNVPAFRIVGFTDIGWAGDFGALFDQEAIVSVGAGVSFLDGIFRIDLAKSVVGGDDFRVLFYTSGLF